MFDDPEKKVAYFEYAVGLVFHSWPVMKQAVEEEWGGVESADKRDWMAGAVFDFITANPDVEADDVEEIILQILTDEFSADVEDDSAYELATDLVSLWKSSQEDDFEPIRKLHETVGKKLLEKMESEGGAGAGSSETANAEATPELVEAPDAQEQSQQQQDPVVDDDGFTMVQRKRRY
ncbi:rRNA processing protein Tsr2 [Schizosaccharomyces japonicus yFS275]|uniref:rRNA processing protein Tsr2 n=1 Tax=Schizosaccharomyces japonicus (strain yFS275 / FY16936) TaxID=402676 RepID=B6K291_SCHJY|nr:rRNA processing protein Tsr2 [Schizosaccharomyces japonicus yFS275]EEB07272.1 rRNA processing protein Tsr2 [Schizosaccharomyces japonicus yFS275]